MLFVFLIFLIILRRLLLCIISDFFHIVVYSTMFSYRHTPNSEIKENPDFPTRNYDFVVAFNS